MDWMRRHQYFAGLAGAGLLVVVGYAMVANRIAIGPSGASNAIDIHGVIQNTDPAAPIPSTPQPVRPTAVDVPYTKITQPSPTTSQTPQNDNFDWNSFIGSLSHATTQMSAGGTDTGISDAYAFVPSNLISPPYEQSLNTMTASQKALYGWGSDAGGAIKSYEDSHPNQAAILTNHMQDRDNPAKIAAMKQLGADLKNVALTIDNMGTPPPQLATAAPELAAAYRDIGEKLAAVPDSKGDEAIVKAILTYNSAAEAFVQKYVNVVLILQANDVKFTQDEPGSVFMFPSN